MTNNRSINNFDSWLKQRLQEPLPGPNVQREMAPFADAFDRFEADRRNARQSAVLINVMESAGRLCFPLIQRPVYQGVHSGQVGLPGGKQDEGDQSVVATALREANEEIGLLAETVQVVGELTDLFVPVSNFIIQPVISVCKQPVDFQPDPREVEEIFLCDLEELVLQQEPSARTEVSTGKGKLEVPFFEVGGKVVWGATAIILGEFRSLCARYFTD